MKFLYSDTQDYVDPMYDFQQDRNASGRRRYWDDCYAHELMEPAPYDGLLVSMSAVRQAEGVANSKVRYSTAEEQRMLRDGARKFLRFGGPKHKDKMLMGDCGAFAYVEHPKPAYSPAEVVEFYSDAAFTHGCAPDHIIFACDTSNPPRAEQPRDVTDRFDITLSNAEEFLRLTEAEGWPFEPLGPIQGWSPESMAEAAVALEKMGYRYLAVGGLVPLKVDVIHQVLQAIRKAIKPGTDIHLLGFAKADKIQEFTGYGITSFDSTSPLIRAFKDAKANYYSSNGDGTLDYYAAIRIPQAIENPRLMQGIKRGIFSAEDLLRREQHALEAIRAFDKRRMPLATALDALTDYQRFLTQGEAMSEEQRERELKKQRDLMARTLEAKPWKQCGCPICRDVGVEVIIFRASNRNKRRGFHNLGVYHKHVQNILEERQ
ncbi:tRNA-guanine transglycosylase DpdA [Cupriavidus necator]|uniref:tRNA-guanine transglycosylase DpdA n=1 Tax=Cupriavidus necator TaxID=106590 RepID=UPI0005B35759|nr:tRNA-guanine transglycosylase DpdA [Cupriavidus necator]